MEALTKHINMEAHTEQKVLELKEEAKKQQQWFENHLASSTELAELAEKERHMKEVQLWADMKLQYEARARGHMSKINTLKMSLDELRAKTDMGAERVRILLHSHMGMCEQQLTEALEKG